MRHFEATVEVKNNLSLVMRERGKITARREGHNIWLNLGREYLAQLMSYNSFTGVFPTAVGVPARNDRIQFMGLGIGGTRQIAPAVAAAAPLSTAYPGANSQTDTDPTVTRLERPVRISGSSGSYPGLASDVWCGQVQAPPTYSPTTSVTYKRLFTQVELSYSPFLTVPLSEIMLFTSAANPLVYNNTGVAYDTFDTLSKTDAFELEVAWTVRF
jgi:hypothetical protein